MKLPLLSKRAKWALALIVLSALAVVVGKNISARKSEKTAQETAATAKRASASIELAPSDTVLAKTITLTNGLPISGSIKAANAVIVKAKVAGELHGLSVREGDFVREGQLLATIDATEFLARQKQAQKTAEAAKAQMDIAQKNFSNSQSLVEQGFISKNALDTSQATLDSTKANYAAALAGVDLAKKSADDTRVLAPISGTISVRAAQSGERLGIDARILEIVNLSRLELEATLSPADSLAVRVGQAATLIIDGSATPLAAHVVRINPSATAGSRAVIIYLAIDKPTGLRQGLFAQGTLATTKLDALAVPALAIRYDKPAPYVQVVENNHVVHQNVTLGEKGTFNGAEYVAVQGLAENAVVLQGHVGAVREGATTTSAKVN